LTATANAELERVRWIIVAENVIAMHETALTDGRHR
jgi:hypothetical protein